MSSMLEQAIVDAAALKEAAIKNAEAAIIEKYSQEIKETVDTILGESPDDDVNSQPLSNLRHNMDPPEDRRRARVLEC